MTSARLSLGIRAVAVFEAAKGLLVLLAGFGLLRLLHHDVAATLAVWVPHLHLFPAGYVPHVFLALAAHLDDRRIWLFALLALCYALLRFVEAYGLWRQRRWAEWLAAGGGALYLPFELFELAQGISRIKLATFTLNLVIVVFMLRVLRGNRTA